MNYTNGTTSSGTFTAPDDFGTSANTNTAFIVGGRAGQNDTTRGENNGNPRLYEIDITRNAALTLARITITDTNTANVQTDGANRVTTGIFAISGTAVPEPASVGLIGLAGMGLLRRRTRANV